MKKIITSLILLFFIGLNIFSQKVKGIQVINYDHPIVVYVNDQPVCPPVYSTFISNLRSGTYKISVTVEIQNQYGEAREREIFNKKVYFNGKEIEIINLSTPQNYQHQYQRPMNPMLEEIMSEDEFKTFFDIFKKQPFREDKIRYISMSINSGIKFTCEQANEIIKKTNFDNEKLDMAKILYPSIIDRKNIYKIINCFSFSSTKEDFEKFINKTQQKRLDNSY